jgi:hypothetical protein
MKVNGNQLVLAGTVSDGNGGTDLFVSAYGARGGVFVCEDHPHKAGNDGANDIAFGGGKVFMCGAQTNAAGNSDFLVRAYDAVKGSLLWERLVDKGANDVASAIAVNTSTGKVFAVGFGATTPVTFDDPRTRRYLVRAYNMNTGALAWEHFADSIRGAGISFLEFMGIGGKGNQPSLTNVFGAGQLRGGQAHRHVEGELPC